MGYLVIFSFFSFSAENEFSSLFYFSLSFQNVICIGRLSFLAENGISFSSAFLRPKMKNASLDGLYIKLSVSD